MHVPVQVTFRDMPVSDAVEAACWEEADKLEREFDRIANCRIVVVEAHGRNSNGAAFEIRIDLSVPGRILVINRRPPPDRADTDVFAALREAFDAARRQLEDYVRATRHEVEHRPAATEEP